MHAVAESSRGRRLPSTLQALTELVVDRCGTNIDFGLLDRLSHLLLCGRCLRQGLKTPVTQVISHRHRLRTLCPACRAEVGPKLRRLPAPLLIF